MLLGIDIGGTTISLGLVEGTRIVKLNHVPSFPKDASLEHTIDYLVGRISDIITPEVRSIGVGVPTIVDVENGIVYNAANIKSWKSDTYTDLWAETKTVNDPCPPGWKVPKNNSIFEGYWSSVDFSAWVWGTYGFKAGTAEDGCTVFPYNGYLYYSSGSFDYFDSSNSLFTGMRIWTCVPYSTAGYCRALQVKNDQSHSATGQRMGNACSIRCVVD